MTFRIKPGDLEKSAIYYRIQHRGNFRQMPAIGTKLVDKNAISLLKDWILELGQ